MTIRMYQCRTGKYQGMWHVRGYIDRAYVHFGRYRDKAEAEQVIEELAEDEN
jgi:hypothetical protein